MIMDFSLLYPNGEIKMKNNLFYNELGLNKALYINERRVFGAFSNENPLDRYLTEDYDTITYRLDITDDFLNIPELCDVINEAIIKISDVTSITKRTSDSNRTESMLYSICEIELYTTCIDYLHNAFQAFDNKIKSKGLKTFIEVIDNLYFSAEYKDLKSNSTEISSEIRSIKSINIGINLSAQLQPTEAGIISINTEKFRSGDLIDRLLRGDILENKLDCLTPLVPIMKGISKEKVEALTYSLLNGIDDIFKNSIKKWQPIIKKYIMIKTDFLTNLLPELSFYTSCTELLKKLKEKDLPLCKPKLFPKEDKVFKINGLYNPLVAIKTEAPMVLNDFSFDENGQIYVLTGANRGGKSVFTYAVGIAQIMLQLGLYIPAYNAEISPVDNILTHFPVTDEIAGEGRLGDECVRLSKIFDNVTKYSLVLMDETMSSTGSYEGSYIAGEVLTGFSIAECRCIFTTHLHELASNVDALNEKNLKMGAHGKIDTLIVGVVDEERSFKIYRLKPEGISHAMSIAEKYGITADKLKEKIEAIK